jgi:hypothetical protein
MDSLSNPKHYMPDEARLAVIREQIDAYNAERPAILRHAYTQVALYMALYVALAGFILVATFHIDEKHKVTGFVAGLAILGGVKLWDYAWSPVRDHQLTLRYRLFPIIFGFIDEVQYSNGYEPGFLHDLNQMKLVRFTSSQNDDLISGMHDGLGFEMVEAKLVIGSGKNQSTVFKGLIFRFNLAQPFPGLLIAAMRGNWLQQFIRDMFGSDADMIASGDWEIDQSHEFHTDNYAAAQPLVEGPLAAALKYLKREWWAGEVRIALRDSECFLLLPADRDYFALPDIKYNVDYTFDIEPMIRDMVVLLAVAHLIRKVGLDRVETPAAPDTVGT